MIEQALISICGIASIWLSNAPQFGHRKWAPLIGLCAQPFWMYAAYKAQQWGILAMTFIYAAGWIRGIHTYWFARRV